MAADTAREREFLEELTHPSSFSLLFGYTSLYLPSDTPGPKRRGAMPRTCHKNSIQIIFIDQTIHVNVAKGQAGT